MQVLTVIAVTLGVLALPIVAAVIVKICIWILK